MLKITIRDVQVATAAHYDVRLAELTGPRKLKALVYARDVAIYIARVVTQKSFPQLGRAFNRDHTTVLHTFHKVSGRITTDERLARAVAAIGDKLAGQPVLEARLEAIDRELADLGAQRSRLVGMLAEVSA